METLSKILTDFNHGIPGGDFLLDTPGSMDDISRLTKPLQSGDMVILYNNDVQMKASVYFDGVWLATPRTHSPHS